MHDIEQDLVGEFLQNTLIVIVLYNFNLYDSITYKCLEEAFVRKSKQKIDLFIYDNSPVADIHLGEFTSNSKFNLLYLHDPSNPGVSRAYNRAADWAKSKDKKLLLVLDQDTKLPAEGLVCYAQAVTSFPEFPLYAPQVYSGGILYSPCRYVFQKGSNLKGIDPGVHQTRYRSVINSGLLINLFAFHKVGGYDDEVQLYFSDHVFFDRIKKYFPRFVVIKCRLEHQLSSVDYNDLSTALIRFAYYSRGARQASHNNNYQYAKHSIMVGLRSLAMSYRFRSLQFLSVFKENFLINSDKA
ncbi:hypothetical protein [Spirosoma luteum]|uniref:hypothetical protein n=1 Tax=Spirosoma luteum TaxID=431553 RepID=UPI000375BD77|nr:hypothetical protein [Spirosoma luteum]